MRWGETESKLLDAQRDVLDTLGRSREDVHRLGETCYFSTFYSIPVDALLCVAIEGYLGLSCRPDEAGEKLCVKEDAALDVRGV